MENKNCTLERFKIDKRSEESKMQLKNRINRAVGQLNGISNMIDQDRYCQDVLIQLSAVIGALKNLGNIILQEHIETCVTEKIKKGDQSVYNELMEIIKKSQ